MYGAAVHKCNRRHVHATDGDTITLMFKPDISKCSNPPNRILIKVTRGSQEYCRMTIDKRICKASDQTSTYCRCVDGSENIQFSMKVDRSSDVVYNWVWSSSDTGTERHHLIRFNVSNSPFSRPVIVGLQTNQVVRVGEDLTLTCVVPCTKSPLSSVNFTCGHRSGSFNRTTGFHTLTFNPLTAADDGAECRCTATWLQDANYFHAEESAVLTVKESKKVVSIPTMIMFVTLSHLVGVLWSGTIFFIILRRKVRPRIRRMRRRRLPPRPNPLCLPTNVAAYDDIPDSWTTSDRLKNYDRKAAAPSKTARELTTVTSTDALKTTQKFLEVPEPAATSTNATKPAASARSRAATPKALQSRVLS
ncbi:uncharacterized protein LOC112568457 [Pomacea canaliculata]|uniref:uncharacterized protein LOC112568457 n=1 Tax=Pomacea canaliculata TaxID=400727 RepID=UPI000D73E339|nr:uncharacterized protein LOC112568457 [Pomacea canaliculata]